MKYVMDRSGQFVIFPKGMNHSDAAKCLAHPVSAGFCSIESYRNQFDDTKYNVRVWGKSQSLGLESNQDDVITITAGLNV